MNTSIDTTNIDNKNFVINSQITNCCGGLGVWNHQNEPYHCEYCGKEDITEFELEIVTKLLHIELKTWAYCCSNCHMENCPIHFDENYKNISQSTNNINTDNWVELYSWQKDYRKKYNLTATQFLRMNKLEPTCSFVQYLTEYGGFHIPIKRDGSIGKKIRDCLIKARSELALGLAVIPKREAKQAFHDFLLDEEKLFIDKGLLSLNIDHIDVDKIDITVIVQCTHNNEHTQNYFKNIVLELFKEAKEFKIGNIKIECHDFKYI